MQGAVVVSRDGSWPEAEEDVERIVAALDRCGIKIWELKVRHVRSAPFSTPGPRVGVGEMKQVVIRRSTSDECPMERKRPRPGLLNDEDQSGAVVLRE